ncbi:TrkH family potassium uptake protein [Faecalimonas umbilicata]|uniref:TrkH family potassium uptake protein n=1 Tax=Faecalimonas umbilicata TaxID=1912855 RepID=UPI00034E9F39|nr:TrkH family potassium uptake protein [Coprococcus sp. HPP0074]
MNYKMTAYVLGKMLGVEALVLCIPAAVSLIYGETSDMVAFGITSAVLCVFFLLFGRKKPENGRIYGKDGLVIVAAAWILWSVFGALPFYLSREIPSYVDALFETVSGFTTTGSTILTDIEALSYGMNFWRCLTHWIGGMGVLVFVMVVTSLDDKSSMHLMRAEVPGPEADKLVPKARETAKLLYAMYLALTVAEIIFLLAGGMNLYDSIIHSFSTAGTGGFANHNSSVAYYDSAYIDGVITVFMILFGINFNMYFLLLIKDVKSVWKNEEVRAYLGIIVAATLVITCNVLSIYKEPLKAFRYSIFQVASIITTTGFATADFNLWPELSKCILLLIMVIGACAGSTGGGVKVSRFLILWKSILKQVKGMLHPKSVNVVKVNGKKISNETLQGVYAYFSAYVFVFGISVLLVALDNFDFATTISGVLTTLSNVGPGISRVGPIENFQSFSVLSKIVFSMDMLIGRLEIFPFLMICSPSFWRKHF